MVCAVASALCRGTMTGLQADRQDGYDNYTGIFFPCSALLVTACYCVSAIPLQDLGLTHTRSSCKGPAGFSLPLSARNTSGFVGSAARGWRMGQIWPGSYWDDWGSPSPVSLHVCRGWLVHLTQGHRHWHPPSPSLALSQAAGDQQLNKNHPTEQAQRA